MLMTNVKLPGAEDYESHMIMRISNYNSGTSLAREFQKHLSEPTEAYGFLYHSKGTKRDIKSNSTQRDYHIQDSKDVSLISVKMSCAINQFPSLSFCGPHSQTHE